MRTTHYRGVVTTDCGVRQPDTGVCTHYFSQKSAEKGALFYAQHYGPQRLRTRRDGRWVTIAVVGP